MASFRRLFWISSLKTYKVPVSETMKTMMPTDKPNHKCSLADHIFVKEGFFL